MRSNRGIPRAFTLIELLVVIAIIGVLIALLLPAVQAAREAARRVQCVNNISQIAMALHNYEGAHEALPPGVVDTSGPILDEPKGYHMGWITQILPYIEENSVYNHLNFHVGAYDQSNVTVRSIVLGVFICPSDAGSGIGTTGAAQTSYAGCHSDIETPINSDNHGLLFLNSAIRSEEIPDGSSHTILLGEKLLDDDLGWASGTRATLRNTGVPINNSRLAVMGMPAPPVPAPADAEATPSQVVGGYSSRHSGGSNFAFGDGSVRFLRDSLSQRVYRALGNRADGELISAKEY